MSKGNVIIIVVATLFIALFAWFAMSRPSVSELDVLQSDDIGASKVERDIVKALNEMENIELRGTVFESPAYKQLVDFSRSVIDEPKGRANPFAPVDPAEILLSGDDFGTSSEESLNQSEDNG